MPPKSKATSKAPAPGGKGRGKKAKIQEHSSTPSDSEDKPSKRKAKNPPASRPAKKRPIADGTLLNLDAFSDEDKHQSSQSNVDDSHELSLTLRSSVSFGLHSVIQLQGGPYDGMQAIVLQYAKPFNFMGLPTEIRDEIYSIALTAEEQRIEIYTKGGPHPKISTKSYGGNNRLALLSVCKDISQTAMPLVYRHHEFVFDKACTLLKFLSQMSTNVRGFLRCVTLQSIEKSYANPALNLLAGCKALETLHIEKYHTSGSAQKLAKTLLIDADTFLRAKKSAKNDANEALSVLTFGSKALMSSSESVMDDEEQRAMYTELLKKISSLK